ncbi:myosin light chain kinase [Biomphalaria glabrata]|nr:myosin light chain kinase [Biomphalaria glabrata]
MSEAFYYLLVGAITMTICMGSLDLFGWSGSPYEEESRMKPSCQKWNAACKDPANSAGNWEEWTEQDNDAKAKAGHRNKGHSDTHGIYVAKPRYDRASRDEIFINSHEDGEHRDANFPEEEEDGGVEELLEDPEDDGVDDEESAQEAEKYRSQRPPLPDSREDTRRRRNSWWQQPGKFKTRPRVRERSPRMRDSVVQTRYFDEEITPPEREVLSSFYQEENGPPLYSESSSNAFLTDDKRSTYYDEEAETEPSFLDDKMDTNRNLLMRKRNCRKCCSKECHSHASTSSESHENALPSDSLKQAREPESPEEVVTSNHLYKTILFIAFIWLFNVAFVIWSMTQRNNVIKMKVTDYVDPQRPSIPEPRKKALNERKDKTSQTAIHPPTRAYHKHQAPSEAEPSHPQLPEYSPTYNPPPPPRPYERNAVVAKEPPVSLEPYSPTDSLTDIPVRLYFKDITEDQQYNSRLIKEYANPAPRHGSQEARPDHTFVSSETAQGIDEMVHSGNVLADTKLADGSYTRKARPGHSGSLMSRIERVKHSEYDMNSSRSRFVSPEHKTDWSVGKRFNYLTAGLPRHTHTSNQNHCEDRKFGRNLRSNEHTSFLGKEMHKGNNLWLKDKLKTRSLSNASTTAIPVSEEKAIKNSLITRSLSATTQCQYLHSAKCQSTVVPPKNDKAEDNSKVDVLKTALRSPLLKQDNISMKTKEKPVLKSHDDVLRPSHIVDVLTRYFERMEETRCLSKPSTVTLEGERKDVKENMYKIFNMYGNHMQEGIPHEKSRGKPKPVMPPPPLGYHIRSCCSSSDTTIREVDSKFELSYPVNQATTPSTSERTSDVEDKQQKRFKQDQIINQNKTKHMNKESSDSVRIAATKDYQTGDCDILKKYVIVRKVSFSKSSSKQRKETSQTSACHRKSSIHVKNDKKNKDKLRQNVDSFDSNDTKLKFAKSSQILSTNDAKLHTNGIQYLDKQSKTEKGGSKKVVLYFYDPSQKSETKKRKKNYTTSVPMKFVERNCNNDNDLLKHAVRFKKSSPYENNESKVKHSCFNYKPFLKRKHSYKKIPLSGCGLSTSSTALNVNANNGSSDKENDGDVSASEQGGDDLEIVSVSDITESTVVPQTEEKADIPDENATLEPNSDAVEDALPEAVADTAQTESSPKTKIDDDAWENRKSIIMQACHEAIKNRLQRQSSEDNVETEESTPTTSLELERKASLPVKLTTDNPPETTPMSPTPPYKDLSPNGLNKRKRKLKTTELYIKFESNISKKLTATMVKDKKIASSKILSERRSLQFPIESCKLEEEKKYVCETPRMTKIVRGNDEKLDKKKRKQNSETSLEHLENKEDFRSSWARDQTDDVSADRKNSEHRFDAVKDLLSAACKGEDFEASEQVPTPTPILNPKSSSPSLPTARNAFCDVKVKSATSDVTSYKGKLLQAAVDAETAQSSSSDIKEGSRKSEPSSTHKLKERVVKRSRHKSSSSPIGTKKGTKKKRTSSSRSKKSADEGSREKSKDSSKKHVFNVSKKSPVRSPKSGEVKAKKKSSKSKDIHGDDNSTSEGKSEKIKTKKSEKSGEKKKKKKKREEVEQDQSEKDDDSSLKQVSSSAPVQIPSCERSRSPTPRSSPAFRSASPTAVSSKSRLKDSKQKKTSKNDMSSDSESQAAERSNSLNTDLPNEKSEKTRKMRKKSCSVSSADNIVNSSSVKRLRPTESVPVFVDHVTSNQSLKSDKTERSTQSNSSVKMKKADKDLQKAELGWNGSLASDHVKQAEEKSKILHRRKMKYMIVKVKNDKLATRLRNSTKSNEPPEGDSIGSHSENEIKSENTSREKVAGSNQPKSVQFSESIEDMEAQKRASSEDILTPPTEEDAPEQRNSEKSDTEAELDEDRSTTEADTVREKTQEVTQRSHSTPPAKRKPVWLNGKKPEVNRPVPMQRQSLIGGNPGKLKQRQSSDAVIKSTRFGGHVSYPTKPAASPRTSALSLGTRLGTSRAVMLNSGQPGPPVTKAKKVTVMTGSPVDIREIIEGSSVDASDHSKAFVVRPTKSVPAFGRNRVGLETSSGKRLKHASFSKKKLGRFHENMSVRSISSNDTGDEHIRNLHKSNGMSSPTLSSMTDLDEASSYTRGNPTSSLTHGHLRRKEKKIKKRVTNPNTPVNWQLVPVSQDQNAIPTAPYSDYSDYDVFQLGLSWMVQRFFHRITNFNPMQRANNPTASGDMTTQRIAD